MSEFYLKDRKTGEVIKKVICDDLESAIEFFMDIKKLEKEDILKIFTISE